MKITAITKRHSQFDFVTSKLSIKLFVLFLIATTLLSVDASAAEKKDKSARRLQQMAQQLQQAEQEKTDLQAQLDGAKKAATEAESKIKRSEDTANALARKIGTSERKAATALADVSTLTIEKTAVEEKLQKTETELESTKKNLAELTDKYQSAQNDLKVGESQRKEQLSTIQQKSARIESCEQKNTKLYGFGLDLIKIFEKPTSYEAAIKTEKFTQLKRVELENTMQEYRDKLEEARIIPTNR